MEGGAGLLQGFHPGEQAFRVQLGDGDVLVGKLLAQLHGLLQIPLLALQGNQMPPHAVAHCVGAGEHEPNFVNGHIQLPQQPDPAEHQHVLFSIIPVAVFRVPPGTDQPLLLVEADVLFRDSRQGLDLVDFQTGHRLSDSYYKPSTRGKVKCFCIFLEKNFAPAGQTGNCDFVQRHS